MKGSIDRPVKPFRIGVLGCGRVFEKYHLPALKQIRDWKLIAICDPLEERVRRIQSSFPGLFAFETPSAFLEQPDLDAVLITTPPATHCQLSIQALNRGLHVLVEKPMALNVCEASLMQETALRAQKQLWVGFNRRFWATRSVGRLVYPVGEPGEGRFYPPQADCPYQACIQVTIS